MPQLLLVDDDSANAESLGDYLAGLGFEIDFAHSGQACIELVLRGAYDAIIMDMMMPGLDGVATCQRLRQRHGRHIPILFLSASDALQDKIEGFRAGADDYLVKPAHPEELRWRLQAILRRVQAGGSAQQTLGELVIDARMQQVYRNGIPIALTQTPFRLFQALADAAPRALTKAQLENLLWEQATPTSLPLRTHIYRLRQAIDAPFERALLRTVHGVGYRLAIPD
ncbi:response regulator transcription factor [Bordetella trematum]|uniref:response regulator transcription factor n=1 Tax=Bordetella trematum TaxID=123899 RepID=UPI003989CE08